MGLGQFFWVWTGLLPALTQKMDQHQITILTIFNHPWFTDHIICVCQQSLPEWESCVSSLVACTMGLSTVPACQMCQKCASMPEGHPWSDWASLDDYRCPRCPEGLDIVPLCQMAVQVPQDCTHGSVYSFVMMIFDCFSLSCDGLLAVFVTIYCFKVYI